MKKEITNPQGWLTKSLIILFLCFFFNNGLIIAEEHFDLNTILMRSTFKIQGENRYTGTAFILGKPLKKNLNQGRAVLITAAHVLENMKGNKATLFLRRKVGNIYEKMPHPITIRDANKELWVKHPEADVAAMYVSLPKNIDLAVLSIDFLADDETFRKHEIHPGDELLCLGYPFSAEANSAGFPILRSGKIASYPIIPAKEMKYFLFDFEVFKGNSGGPVYFVQSGRTIGRSMHVGTIQFIAGLVSQEYLYPEKMKFLYEEQTILHPLALAKIIYAQFIKETIELLPEKE
jgi:S1-C subfamily serine protease